MHVALVHVCSCVQFSFYFPRLSFTLFDKPILWIDIRCVGGFSCLMRSVCRKIRNWVKRHALVHEIFRTPALNTGNFNAYNSPRCDDIL